MNLILLPLPPLFSHRPPSYFPLSAVTLRYLGGKATPLLIYFVLKKEPLSLTEMALFYLLVIIITITITTTTQTKFKSCYACYAVLMGASVAQW